MKNDKPDTTRPKAEIDKLKERLGVLRLRIEEHKTRWMRKIGQEKLTWNAGEQHRRLLDGFRTMKPNKGESALAYAIRRGDLAHAVVYWAAMEREAVEDLRKLRTKRDSILWKLHVMQLRQAKRDTQAGDRKSLWLDNIAATSAPGKKKPQPKKKPLKTKQTSKKPATYRNTTPPDFAEDTMNGDDYDAGCR